jgi:hypothetical protein
LIQAVKLFILLLNPWAVVNSILSAARENAALKNADAERRLCEARVSKDGHIRACFHPSRRPPSAKEYAEEEDAAGEKLNAGSY